MDVVSITKLGSPQWASGVWRDSEPVLSLIVPAYNERRRLPSFLLSARAYLDVAFAGGYEVIVVDDGSHDGTAEYLEGESSKWSQLSFVRHLENIGKGAAVKTGMEVARGELRMFADADGATPIAEEAKLRAAVANGAHIAIGSRAITCATAAQSRALVRGLIGAAWSRVARSVLPLPVLDTQCGFKLFRREAAQRLFANLSETGFAFDLELLVLARRLGYEIREVPVSWTEVPGSKVRIVRDSLRMVRSLVSIRRRMNQPAFVVGGTSQPHSLSGRETTS